MSVAALYTIAKTWKQPKCPSTDEWIKKMCYVIYKGIVLSYKNNKIMPFAATWMQLEIPILSEVKSERERQIPYDMTYTCSIKYGIDEPTYKTETHSQT